MDKNNKQLDPQEYFDYLKGKKETVDNERLKVIYDNAEDLLKGFMITKQIDAAKKMIFHMETVEKEQKLLSMGINTFVYREDVEDYIDNVAKNVVKIIELEKYLRNLPQEAIEAVEKTQGLFTQYFVVFTDYTGKVEKQIKKEERRKDPILFGAFYDKDLNTIVDRFYFLADWEDEHCDLTLDKMVNEMKKEQKREIRNTPETPVNLEELRATIHSIEEAKRQNSDYAGISFTSESKVHPPKPPSIFKKIRTWFSREKKR